MFQPAIPVGGYAGWKIFERVADKQLSAFADQASVQRDIAYFRDHVGEASSAAELVGDRRLLSVALGAFGLEDEIGKKALIRRVLEEGATDPRSFANRLNDPRWKAFAAAFSFNDVGGAPSWSPSFKESISSRYVERAFERAVGESDQSFRLAMNFRREAKLIAAGPNVDRVGWLQIMGQRPLRAVAEAALGLPASIAHLDVDRQRAMFEEKAEKVFGTKSAKAFLESENVDLAIRRFFALDSATNTQAGYSSGATALTLLASASPSSGAAAIGLILSNSSGVFR